MENLKDFMYGNYHLKLVHAFIHDKKNRLLYGVYSYVTNVTKRKGYMVIVYRGEPALDNIYATYTFETIKGLNEYYMLAFGHKVTDTIFKGDIQRIKSGAYSFLGTNPLEDNFFLDLVDIERMDVPKHKGIDEFKPSDLKDFEGRIFPEESCKQVVVYKGNDFNGTIDVAEFGETLRLTIN